MKHLILNCEDQDIISPDPEIIELLAILSRPSYFVLMSPNMPDAALFERQNGGDLNCVRRCKRQIIEQFVQNNWLNCVEKGKVNKYKISLLGKEAYREFAQANDIEIPYFSHFQNTFGDQATARGGVNRLQSNETPIQTLARKRDKTGKPYLTARMVEAAERLYEDFEISAIGQCRNEEWRDMIAKTDIEGVDVNLSSGGIEEAKKRWAAAMLELGAGLSDITYWVCCVRQGLETAEKKLEWSARSGKIVLRIALMRLADFYQIPDLK